jgi:hypothetical protein
MRGTQIVLTDYAGSEAARILDITYPTADVRKALLGVAQGQGRPVVIIGERGRGKSHIMAVLTAAFREPAAVQQWAASWAGTVDNSAFAALTLPQGFAPLSLVMSDQDFATLWEPIFRFLPNGAYYRGRFAEAGTSTPSRALMLQAFSEHPTALLLDELQTWYDALEMRQGDPNPTNVAFNFLQILAGVAATAPHAFRLIASVRDSDTDAYSQIVRNTSVLVDFKGSDARQDRIRLTQHRLFQNYRQIQPAAIAAATAGYAGERVRLLYPEFAGPRQEEVRAEVRQSWPFAPELMGILEDEILMSAVAQNTRDLMRILVRLYKARGDAVPLLTLADIDVRGAEGAADELASMVDITAGSGARLREVAQRNLDAVLSQEQAVPHAGELLSALWVRSLSQAQQRGATPEQLHLDLTRAQPVDDNAFEAELARLIEASFNVHSVGNRLVFRVEENPRAKLLASAKNGNLFQGQQDLLYLQKAIGAALSPADGALSSPSRLIVLGADWESAPWTGLDTMDWPGKWQQPVVLVLPERAGEGRLGNWLRQQVPEHRNLARFLMPSGAGSVYADAELRQLARCAFLAYEWRSDGQYARLLDEFRKPLLEKLRQRFERLAVLRTWNYQQPEQTRFDESSIDGGGQSILARIDQAITSNVFDSTRFREYVVAAAARGQDAYQLIVDLMEPPPSPDDPAIPFLGVTQLYERLLAVAARGDIVLNVKDRWLRREPNEDPAVALARLQKAAWATPREMQEIVVALPHVAAPTPVVTPPPVPPVSVPGSAPGFTSGNTPPTLFPPAPPFGGVIKEPPPVSAPIPIPTSTIHSQGARNKANLLGDFQQWQFQDKVINGLRLTGVGLTYDLLKRFINSLPPECQFSVEVDVQDQDQ